MLAPPSSSSGAAERPRAATVSRLARTRAQNCAVLCCSTLSLLTLNAAFSLEAEEGEGGDDAQGAATVSDAFVGRVCEALHRRCGLRNVWPAPEDEDEQQAAAALREFMAAQRHRGAAAAAVSGAAAAAAAEGGAKRPQRHPLVVVVVACCEVLERARGLVGEASVVAAFASLLQPSLSPSPSGVRGTGSNVDTDRVLTRAWARCAAAARRVVEASSAPGCAAAAAAAAGSGGGSLLSQGTGAAAGQCADAVLRAIGLVAAKCRLNPPLVALLDESALQLVLLCDGPAEGAVSQSSRSRHATLPPPSAGTCPAMVVENDATGQDGSSSRAALAPPPPAPACARKAGGVRGLKGKRGLGAAAAARLLSATFDVLRHGAAACAPSRDCASPSADAAVVIVAGEGEEAPTGVATATAAAGGGGVGGGVASSGTGGGKYPALVPCWMIRLALMSDASRQFSRRARIIPDPLSDRRRGIDASRAAGETVREPRASCRRKEEPASPAAVGSGEGGGGAIVTPSAAFAPPRLPEGAWRLWPVEVNAAICAAEAERTRGPAATGAKFERDGGRGAARDRVALLAPALARAREAAPLPKTTLALDQTSIAGRRDGSSAIQPAASANTDRASTTHGNEKRQDGTSPVSRGSKERASLPSPVAARSPLHAAAQRKIKVAIARRVAAIAQEQQQQQEQQQEQQQPQMRGIPHDGPRALTPADLQVMSRKAEPTLDDDDAGGVLSWMASSSLPPEPDDPAADVTVTPPASSSASSSSSSPLQQSPRAAAETEPRSNCGSPAVSGANDRSRPHEHEANSAADGDWDGHVRSAGLEEGLSTKGPAALPSVPPRAADPADEARLLVMQLNREDARKRQAFWNARRVLVRRAGGSRGSDVGGLSSLTPEHLPASEVAEWLSWNSSRPASRTEDVARCILSSREASQHIRKKPRASPSGSSPPPLLELETPPRASSAMELVSAVPSLRRRFANSPAFQRAGHSRSTADDAANRANAVQPLLDGACALTMRLLPPTGGGFALHRHR